MEIIPILLYTVVNTESRSDGGKMTEETIKERLGEAYARAIAAYAGIKCNRDEEDYGFDGTFKHVTFDAESKRYRDSGYAIDYQLKSTVNAELRAGKVIYDLEVKNYNDLIVENVGTPRILIVFKLPTNKAEWLLVNQDNLILRNCAWWCSLKGQNKTTNTSKVRIEIPEDQILTPNTLQVLMSKVQRGVDL